MEKHFLNFVRHYKAHLVSWGLFIAYEILMIGVVTGVFNSFWDYFVHYTLNISLFYLHATFVLPSTLRKHPPRYWLVPLLVISEIVMYIALTYTVEHAVTQYLGVQLSRVLQFDYFYCLRSTWRAVYFMGFATGYFFLMSALGERRRAELSEKKHLINIIEKQELQNELIKSQNAFLKAQINPHFLFNTLSFVYNSVRKTSTQAADTIMSLSHMMRYALQNENEHQESELLEEIELVENLIQIHQHRNNHQLHLDFIYGNNLAGIRFVPLVLLTLVENMFKHGQLDKANCRALIHISLDRNELLIKTCNLANVERPSGHRIGLDNIRKRLQLVYNEKVAFEAYVDEKAWFHTLIKVDTAGPFDFSLSQAPHTQA